MTKAPLWTRDFIIVSLLNFLLVLVFYLLVVVMGLYATQVLHATPSQAGLAVGMFVVGILAGRLIVGQYIDRIGRKRSMLLGLFFSIIGCLGYFIEGGILFLIINRFIHGLAVGFAATAASTAVAHIIPISRKGEGIGFYSMSTSLSTAIGPFIGLMMTQQVGFKPVLALCALVSVTSLVVGWLLRVPEAEELPEAAPRQFSIKRLLHPTVVPLCSLMFVLGACYSGVLSYLNAFAVERQLVQAASFFFIVYAVTILLSRPITGRLLDARGANLIMYPALVLMALGFLVLAKAQVGWALLVAGALIGLGFGNIQSCIQAQALKMVAPNQMGLATATFFILMDAGLGFGPYLLGFVIPWTGYAGLYLAIAALTFLTIGVYYAVHGRRPIPVVGN
ncbi:MFS transporter [Halioxenophilus sp. WMMB6]|uniref:MFS transporter n=1 Tax=Halioxenophilus sp. WMMB6 TaxID=3073815 RepID=UPI00295EEACE|nr:MFS transporter [Halioxenophilus sp. WMMB6]